MCHKQFEDKQFEGAVRVRAGVGASKASMLGFSIISSVFGAATWPNIINV